jgi:hypothetical protein
MNRLDRVVDEIAGQISEDVTEDLVRRARESIREAVRMRIEVVDQGREEVLEIAKKIAREHRCREVGCRCGEEIAVDLDLERLR